MVKVLTMEILNNETREEAKMATIKGTFHLTKEISKDNDNWNLAFDQYMNTHVFSNQKEIAEDFAKFGVEKVTMVNFLNNMLETGNHDRMLTPTVHRNLALSISRLKTQVTMLYFLKRLMK